MKSLAKWAATAPIFMIWLAGPSDARAQCSSGDCGSVAVFAPSTPWFEPAFAPAVPVYQSTIVPAYVTRVRARYRVARPIVTVPVIALPVVPAVSVYLPGADCVAP